ncbi:MAG: penicillin-binding protein, partial [Phocaeicola sp.]
MRKFLICGLWFLLLSIIVAIALTFTAIARGWIGYVPPVEELENPNLKFATEVLSDDGQTIGTFSLSKENRIFVDYNQLP